MDEDSVELEISIPLDADGFVRRLCPTCDREFKWLHTESPADSVNPTDGGYFCPYCAIQAESWFTVDQIEIAQNAVMSRVVNPMLEDFGRNLDALGNNSSYLNVDVSLPDETPSDDLVVDSDDMARIEFSCHPSEPVKILDGWDAATYCLVCGNVSD